MASTAQAIEPYATTSGGDMDTRVTFEVFKRHHTTVRQLLRGRYQVYPGDSIKHTSAEQRRKYCNSGLWNKWRDKETGALEVSVDVGCFCEHDCCGHRCSLRLSFILDADWIYVCITEGFNY